jgi:hypothetical protein
MKAILTTPLQIADCALEAGLLSVDIIGIESKPLNGEEERDA